MNYKTAYDIQEDLGRKAFSQLIKNTVKDVPEIKYEQDPYSIFDASFTYKNAQNITKYVFVEIKVRSRKFNEYILESKKFNAMHNIYKSKNIKKEDVSLLYVNFCPDGSFIWDMDEIESKYTLQDSIFNRNTTESRYNKTQKQVYYLKTSDAIKYNFIIKQ
tara:strand:- start:1651 stop:2133 length:483 start_codon:yes stop_codon:yes gene_type:complete